MKLVAVTVVFAIVFGHSYNKRVRMSLSSIEILLCFDNSSQINKEGSMIVNILVDI